MASIKSAKTLEQPLDRLAVCLEKVSEKKLADSVRQSESRFAACKKKAETAAELSRVEQMIVNAMERAHKWPPRRHDALRSDLIAAFTALSDVAVPPAKPKWETTSGKFAGFEVDYIEGDPADAERIAKNAAKLAKKFAEWLVVRDYESAYALLSSTTREWMSLKRFVSDHEKSMKQLAGALPVSFEVQEIRRIYADAKSQKEANSTGGFPKQMPREQKRATVQLFFTTTKKPAAGCWSFLWIAEESRGEFRVAKWNYYLM